MRPILLAVCIASLAGSAPVSAQESTPSTPSRERAAAGAPTPATSSGDNLHTDMQGTVRANVAGTHRQPTAREAAAAPPPNPDITGEAAVKGALDSGLALGAGKRPSTDPNSVR